MNFVKSLAKQFASRAFASTALRRDRSGPRLQVSGGSTQEKLKQFGSKTPLGRAGQPAELGSIYVQLAACDASFATGQVYVASAAQANRKG